MYFTWTDAKNALKAELSFYKYTKGTNQCTDPESVYKLYKTNTWNNERWINLFKWMYIAWTDATNNESWIKLVMILHAQILTLILFVTFFNTFVLTVHHESRQQLCYYYVEETLDRSSLRTNGMSNFLGIGILLKLQSG